MTTTTTNIGNDVGDGESYKKFSNNDLMGILNEFVPDLPNMITELINVSGNDRETVQKEFIKAMEDVWSNLYTNINNAAISAGITTTTNNNNGKIGDGGDGGGGGDNDLYDRIARRLDESLKPVRRLYIKSETAQLLKQMIANSRNKFNENIGDSGGGGGGGVCGGEGDNNNNNAAATTDNAAALKRRYYYDKQSCNAELQAFGEEVRFLKRKLNEIQQEKASIDRGRAVAVSELDKSVAGLKAENATLSNDNARLRNELDAQRRVVDETSIQIESLKTNSKRELLAVEKNLQAARNKKEQFKTDAAKKSKELEFRDKELNRVRNEQERTLQSNRLIEEALKQTFDVLKQSFDRAKIPFAEGDPTDSTMRSTNMTTLIEYVSTLDKTKALALNLKNFVDVLGGRISSIVDGGGDENFVFDQAFLDSAFKFIQDNFQDDPQVAHSCAKLLTALKALRDEYLAKQKELADLEVANDVQQTSIQDLRRSLDERDTVIRQLQAQIQTNQNQIEHNLREIQMLQEYTTGQLQKTEQSTQHAIDTLSNVNSLQQQQEQQQQQLLPDSINLSFEDLLNEVTDDNIGDNFINLIQGTTDTTSTPSAATDSTAMSSLNTPTPSMMIDEQEQQLQQPTTPLPDPSSPYEQRRGVGACRKQIRGYEPPYTSKEINKLNAQIERLEDENESLRSKLSEQQEQFKLLSLELHSVQTDYSYSTKRIGDLEQAIKRLNLERDELTDQLKRFEGMERRFDQLKRVYVKERELKAETNVLLMKVVDLYNRLESCSTEDGARPSPMHQNVLDVLYKMIEINKNIDTVSEEEKNDAIDNYYDDSTKQIRTLIADIEREENDRRQKQQQQQKEQKEKEEEEENKRKCETVAVSTNENNNDDNNNDDNGGSGNDATFRQPPPQQQQSNRKRSSSNSRRSSVSSNKSFRSSSSTATPDSSQCRRSRVSRQRSLNSNDDDGDDDDNTVTTDVDVKKRASLKRPNSSDSVLRKTPSSSKETTKEKKRKMKKDEKQRVLEDFDLNDLLYATTPKSSRAPSVASNLSVNDDDDTADDDDAMYGSSEDIISRQAITSPYNDDDESLPISSVNTIVNEHADNLEDYEDV